MRILDNHAEASVSDSLCVNGLDEIAHVGLGYAGALSNHPDIVVTRAPKLLSREMTHQSRVQLCSELHARRFEKIDLDHLRILGMRANVKTCAVALSSQSVTRQGCRIQAKVDHVDSCRNDASERCLSDQLG